MKSGIETRNNEFNILIEMIEKVAIRSVDPILLTGPTGAGKSQLARRIYELDRFAEKTGNQVSFNKEAKEKFLNFAVSSAAIWTATFFIHGFDFIYLCIYISSHNVVL